MKTPWSLRLKRLGVSIFVIAHATVLIFWNLPGGVLRQRVMKNASYYMMPLGLWQYWNMFGPEPVKAIAELEAVVTDGKGMIHVFPFAHMADIAPWKRFLYIRDAKFAAMLADDENKPLREIAARHAARTIGLPREDFPLIVELRYQIREIPPPDQPPLDPMSPPKPVLIQAYRFDSWAEAQP